jgi:3-oxoisoapionate kinase
MDPLLTFYGDDFTGSSAVLEILAFAGVPTVMFLDVPSPALLAKLKTIRAVGIAGIARSKDPAWMSAELPRYFKALKAMNAPVLHYKTCSTFDSAPHLGSIGRATEIGMAITDVDWAPLVVGAPAIGRYQIFGTLFAALDGIVHRLDRHSVMAQHPATPMHEADLCRHLDAQTRLPKAVVDWRDLLAGRGGAALDAARKKGAKIIALDVFDDPTLAATGQILWEESRKATVFAVGSQGVEYALVAHWRRTGLLPAARPMPVLEGAGPLLVVSGSCSTITARQIDVAEAGGFTILELDACKALVESDWDTEIIRVDTIVQKALREGRNVLVCTARGPEDPAVRALNLALDAYGINAAAIHAKTHARLGNGLGRLVREARIRCGLKRAIFSGGDTSGHAMLAVGAQALEPVTSLASGVPLLRIHSGHTNFDGMEVALKGGQMGDPEIFLRAAHGSQNHIS